MMKYLAYYKKLYRKAKTQKGRESAVNNAMLNLYPDDKKKFIQWQIQLLNNKSN